MVRARNLHDGDIEMITSLLDGWVGPLTWNALIDEVERRLHVRYVRQTLHKHVRIADAFRERQDALREDDGAVPEVPTSPELQSIARLEAENDRLKAENQRLLEQFLVWAYNANSRGISEEVLSRPLPAVDRGRSDGEKPGGAPKRVK